MQDVLADCRTRWNAVFARLGVAAPDPAPVFEAWQSSGRWYHTLEHLDEVLRAMNWLDDEPSPAAVLAGFFHDAVYDASRQDNEAQSAALARRVLADAGIDSDLIDDVETLVMATVTHVLPAHESGQHDAAVLLDADLLVLARDPDGYERYLGQIRREFARYSDTEWAIGRAAVVDVLLALARINELFHTDAARPLTEQARINLERERAELP